MRMDISQLTTMDIEEVIQYLRYTVWDELVAEDIGLPLPALDLYVKTSPEQMR
jgi:hypothetical protein